MKLPARILCIILAAVMALGLAVQAILAIIGA